MAGGHPDARVVDYLSYPCCASPGFPETSEPGLILLTRRKEVLSGSDQEVPDRAA